MKSIEERIAALSPSQREKLEMRLKKEGISIGKQVKITTQNHYLEIQPGEEKDYYDLSYAQRRIFILHQLEEEAIGYNINGAVLIVGHLDKERIEDLFKKLITRHGAFRTNFRVKNGEPVQQVHREVRFGIRYFPLKNEKIISIIDDFIRPFDLKQAPLLRVGLIGLNSGNHILIFDMHHIISDGISIEILVWEFTAMYNRLPLPGLRIQYVDFCQWQEKVFTRETTRCQGEFWNNSFHGEIPVLNLFCDKTRPEILDFDGSSIEFSVGVERLTALKKVAHETGTTIYMLLLSMFSLLLFKLTNQEDIVVGTPVGCRRHPDLEWVIGMFVNTLPLRTRPSREKPFTQFLREIKEITLEAFENQEYPFEELVEQLEVPRDTARNPLFDVMFAFQGPEGSGCTTAVKGKNSHWHIEPYEYEKQSSIFDLTLRAQQREQEIYFNIEYRSALFKRKTIERFAGYFKRIMDELLENRDKPVADIEIMPLEERRRIMDDFNDTTAVYPKEKLLHQLFAEQARRTPHYTALMMENKNTFGVGYLTYKELNEKANQLAHLLKEKGVEPDAILGIMMERSGEMIIGILGILKVGGAYLPIDPGYPQERIDYMLQESKAQALVVDNSSYASWLSFLPKVILNFSEGHHFKFYHSTLPPVHPSQSSNLAYVIYTSGSTGRPKGVAIEHRGIVNRLFWMADKYDLKETDVILQKTVFTFDVSVWELFLSLITGGRMCLAVPGGEKSPDYLYELMNREGVTMVHFVPSMLSAFLQAFPHGLTFGGLKHCICSGERLTPAVKELFFDRIGGNVLLHNLYGPTEASVDVTYYPVEQTDQRIPIGKPVANTKLYILDEEKKSIPIGVPGELCISGIQVARGYLNQPELTAEKFGHYLWDYQDYHDGYYSSHKSYMPYIYRSGDLARWLPDGNIEFLGRMDQQVKIRGYRIEMEEIQSVLLKHESVKEAVVTVREMDEQTTALCAYVVNSDGLTSKELREFLALHFPGYMIPSYFVHLEKLPLTSNGKVDRRSLPPPAKTREQGIPFVPPKTTMEQLVANVWENILRLDNIGIDDNFFDRGGNSLMLIKVNSQLKSLLNREIRVMDMFKYPTIYSLARYLDKGETIGKFAVDERTAVLMQGKKGHKQRLKKRKGAIS